MPSADSFISIDLPQSLVVKEQSQTSCKLLFSRPDDVSLEIDGLSCCEINATEMRGYYISRKQLTRAQKVEQLTRIASLAPVADRDMILSVVNHKKGRGKLN